MIIHWAQESSRKYESNKVYPLLKCNKTVNEKCQRILTVLWLHEVGQTPPQNHTFLEMRIKPD